MASILIVLYVVLGTTTTTTEYQWSTDRHRFAPMRVKRAICTMLTIRVVANLDPTATSSPTIGALPTEVLSRIFAFAWHRPSLVAQWAYSCTRGSDHLERLIKLGDPDLVKDAMPHYNFADVQKDFVRNKQYLHDAVARGNVEVISVLLDAKADPLWKRERYTPLDVAIRHGRFDAARFLLDLVGPDHITKATIDSCLSSEDPKMFQLVVSRARDSNQRHTLLNSPKEVVTPLASACSCGSDELLRALVELKADVNHPGKGGRTPLGEAMKAHRHSTLRLLVELRADINQPFSSTRTFVETVRFRCMPLEFAIDYCTSDTVRYLLGLGASKSKLVPTRSLTNIHLGERYSNRLHLQHRIRERIQSKT